MKKEHQISIWYVLFAIMAVIVIRDLFLSPGHIRQIDYSEFQTLLSERKIDDLIVGRTRISGSFKDARQGEPTHFVTQRVDPDIAAELEKSGIRFTGEPEPGLLQNALSWILPSAVFIALWMFLLRPLMGGGAGGLMSIGKSKAKVYVETAVKVTFADVAGVDEAKVELQEIVAFLKNPKDYGRLGARMPKGILLVGPPGTGKTLLARAVAGEAGVPFFSISGSEFVEMFVGVGAARVRDLFEQARGQAPAIIFIDELDALGRARGAFPLGGGHDEKEQTLNQLLSELDGFDTREGLVLLAATNRPEILDPALLRAGRFDRQILVDRPDKVGRAQILHVHLRKVQLAADVDPEKIAALTPGFSGADLANLVNEAALLATRRGGDAVSLDDFSRAVERIVAGLEKKNRLLNPKERAVVAYHELGHALVALSLPGSDAVHKVSIIPRGIGSLGYTIQRPTEDRYLMSRAELENKMAVLLGGRAAEAVIFDEISTGAADDLARATDIARSMVARYGMTEELGPVAYDEEPSRLLGMPLQMPGAGRRYSEQSAAKIDDAVRLLIEAAFSRARAIIVRHHALIDAAAKELLSHETLSERDLAALFPREALRQPEEKAPTAARA